MEELKLFNKWPTKDIKFTDKGIEKYISLKPAISPRSQGRLSKHQFYKSQMNIVERLMNHLQNPGHRGKKHFISNAGEAEVYVVLAKTGRNDISMFLVEKDTEGLVIGRREEKLGLRGVPMGELIFEECVIPKENLMGKEGEGLRIAMASLDKDRIGIGAIGIGIASAALDAAKEFAKKRKQFGQPIANFQAIQFMIADMSTEIDAARFLTYRGAYLFDRGERVTKEASMAKLYSSEMAMRVAINAMQIHGGYGCTKDYPIERYLRDAKMLTLMVGTSEMQRIVIARNEMK